MSFSLDLFDEYIQKCYSKVYQRLFLYFSIKLLPSNAKTTFALATSTKWESTLTWRHIRFWVCWPLIEILVQFHQHFTRSFCASRFTPILLAHGVKRGGQKLSVYLSVYTSKVERIFDGETDQCRQMTTGAFTLCARRLVKLKLLVSNLRSHPSIRIRVITVNFISRLHFKWLITNCLLYYKHSVIFIKIEIILSSSNYSLSSNVLFNKLM